MGPYKNGKSEQNCAHTGKVSCEHEDRDQDDVSISQRTQKIANKSPAPRRETLN